MTTGNVGSLLRFGLPGLVLGVMLAWFSTGTQAPLAQQAYTNNRGANGNNPMRSANAMPGMGQDLSGAASGTIAFCQTDPVNPSATRLVIIDAQKKAIAVYRIEQAERMVTKIKLESARQYKWDLDLTEYNNLPPAVSAVSTMVRNPNVNSTSDVPSNANPNSRPLSHSEEH